MVGAQRGFQWGDPSGQSEVHVEESGKEYLRRIPDYHSRRGPKGGLREGGRLTQGYTERLCRLQHHRQRV